MSNHERTATERPYLSIGEVLGLLLDEFPDVTISKIRFLESQGLIEPERTASGYRKFYDADVDRLRFILREQRENYLPLKVIRDRLEGETPTGGVPRADDTTAVMTRPQVEAADAAATMPTTSRRAAPEQRRPEAAAASGDGAASSTDRPAELPTDATVRSHPAGSAPLPGATPPADPAVADTVAPDADSAPQLELGDAPVTDVPTPERAPEPAANPPAPAADTVAAAPASPDPAPAPPARAPRAPATGQLSRTELLSATGIDGKLLDELEAYGMVSSRSIGQQLVYDGAARQLCEIAGAFQQLGIEVRHLRAWKTSAEREAGLFEQRILPLLRQRNPSAREQSTALLEQMAKLGADLHHVLVGQALSQYLTD